MAGFRINKEQRKAMLNAIAGDVERHIPPGFGFGVMVFSFGEGGELHWVSNAERECMIQAMQEFIAKEAN